MNCVTNYLLPHDVFHLSFQSKYKMEISHGHFLLRTTRPKERSKKIDVVALLQRIIKTKLHIFLYWKCNICPLRKNETLRITVKHNNHEQLLMA